MAAIDVQPPDARRPDERHVARRRGPQPGPELDGTLAGQPREQRHRAAHQGRTALRRQAGVEAVELGRPGDAQTLTEARKDDLAAIVGKADHWRRITGRQRDGCRVAFGRIDRQPDADFLQQRYRITAGGNHVGIADQALAAGQTQSACLARHCIDMGHGAVMTECDATPRCRLGQATGKKMGIAGFVVGRECPAHDGYGRRCQRRLDGQALGSRFRQPVAAELPHQFRLRQGMGKLPLIGIEMQDSALLGIVSQGEGRSHLLEQAAAVQGQAQDGQQVAPTAARGALGKKAHAPEPLLRIGAQAPEQGRILAAQPAQQLAEDRRVGPGFGMTGGNLPAVGETGLAGDPGLALEHRHLVPVLHQMPGGTDPDQARAYNDDMHCGPSSCNLEGSC